VPRCWPGETVAILCGGTTLTPADVDHLHGRCRVIAVNRQYVLAPWADWLYACDPGRFWQWCGGPGRLYPDEPDAWEFVGIKITAWSPSLHAAHLQHLQALVAACDVKVLRHAGHGFHEGASGDPGVIYGNNSLYQMLSVVRHTGARRVLLLGADMLGGHWHQKWPMDEPNYKQSVVPRFATLADSLHGIEVVNCAPKSALDVFPMRALREVLP